MRTEASRRSILKAGLAGLVLAAGLAASAPASAQDKLTVLLDWFVNPDHAPLYVAREMGYFRDAGLEVEMIAPADPNDPPKLVAAGRADLAVSYQPQLQMQAAEGLPLTRIGTLVATPLNTVVVLADGPVKSIADLKGRKVGYSVGGLEDALLGAMDRIADDLGCAAIHTNLPDDYSSLPEYCNWLLNSFREAGHAVETLRLCKLMIDMAPVALDVANDH